MSRNKIRAGNKAPCSSVVMVVGTQEVLEIIVACRSPAALMQLFLAIRRSGPGDVLNVY